MLYPLPKGRGFTAVSLIRTFATASTSTLMKSLVGTDCSVLMSTVIYGDDCKGDEFCVFENETHSLLPPVCFFQSLIIWYANKKEAIPKGICVERNRQAQKCLPVDVICTKLKSVTLWVQ